MTAGNICSRKIATARGEDSVRSAALRMAEHGMGTLVVTMGNGASAPAGIVTDRDIVVRCVAKGLDPAKTQVSKIMTQPVHAVDEDSPVEDAILRMAEGASRRMVVTGEGGRLVGVLSLDDVISLLIKEVKPLTRLLEAQAPAHA